MTHVRMMRRNAPTGKLIRSLAGRPQSPLGAIFSTVRAPRPHTRRSTAPANRRSIMLYDMPGGGSRRSDDGGGEGRTRPLVLNVNDRPTARFVAAEMLRGFSLEVIDAATGEEAIAIAQALRPDLVVLDVLMPELDGIEVCRMLKGDSLTSAIPVILTSAALVNPTGQLTSGADAYLPQPFDLVHLRSLLETLLGSLPAPVDGVRPDPGSPLRPASRQLARDTWARIAESRRLIEFSQRMRQTAPAASPTPFPEPPKSKR